MAGQVWQALEPRSVLIPNGLSAMGFGVPAAIAARLTRPDRPVIALVGDGGFAMAATEMRIASALGLPVTVVDTPAALEKALEGFAARTQPLIIEAQVDPSQYEAQF